jgi:hypothetical protein
MRRTLTVKIGAENKKQLRIMLVLLAILLLVGIYNFVDFGTSSASSPAPASSTQVAQSAKKAGAPQLSDSTLDPRLHVHELAVSQNVKYQEGGRNIFRMEEVKIPQMQGSARQITEMGPPMPPTPTPTPPPPPIPLKFFGIASKAGEPKRALLADGEDVFVAKEGDIVDRHYKVNKIGVNSVEILDVLNNNVQTIPLTAQG